MNGTESLFHVRAVLPEPNVFHRSNWVIGNPIDSTACLKWVKWQQYIAPHDLHEMEKKLYR